MMLQAMRSLLDKAEGGYDMLIAVACKVRSDALLTRQWWIYLGVAVPGILVRGQCFAACDHDERA